MSVSYTKLGDVKLQQKDTAGDLAAYEAGLGISEKLAAADPRDAQGQRDWMFSHYKLGLVRKAEKKFDLAAKEFERAIKILEEFHQRLGKEPFASQFATLREELASAQAAAKGGPRKPETK